MILDELYESAQTCPKCGGPAFSNLILAEKKDACYNKVRSRYKVWPSAYASGALVQCRKKGAANWGNKSKNEDVVEAVGTEEQMAMQTLQRLISFAKDNPETTMAQLASSPLVNRVKAALSACDALIEFYTNTKQLGNAEFVRQLKHEINYFLTEKPSSSDPLNFGDLLQGKLGKVNFQQGVAEDQLDEKCWDTHRQAGMKKKGDRMVPNCVPKEGVAEGDKVGNMDADRFDDAMSRLKKLAAQGPRKTVWDPEKRVHKTVPVNPQPK